MRPKTMPTMLIIVLGLVWATGALAQTALPAPNAGFDITGFIQSATLNANPRAGVDPALRGGRITVNGNTIVVPNNTLVQFPASTWTWPQLFDPNAWAPIYGPDVSPVPLTKALPPAGSTGLALNDPLENHFPSYEVHVVGNIITNPVSGLQTYIAGLIVPVAQQGLNGQGGYINLIDYAAGRFYIGGQMDTATGTLVEINDPVGRYGKIHSPDQRFTSDTGNPTIIAATGYPVCIPRVAPPDIDPVCPITNRPPNGGAFGTDPFLAAGAPLKFFTMPAVPQVLAGGPDPRQMVPLMKGDWVNVSGTVFKIDPAGLDTFQNQYLSVHTLNAHLGIKTAPGTKPAYIAVEELIFGVGDGNPNVPGPTVAGIAQETSTRVVLVAFTTDADANQVGNECLAIPAPGLPGATILGINVDPTSGAETEVQFPNGSTALNPTELCMDDPVRGRIRLQFNKNPKPPVLGQSNAAGPGKFYREYLVRLTGPGRGALQLPDQVPGVLPGLITGQYRLPIFEYIFGEGTVFGQPVPPFNFRDFGFLVRGQGPTGPGGVNVGPLTPFPVF
jgi:hypothetical protein